MCLQLYDPASFSDRVSGVTIDAFLAGAPVVAREGTWISRQVQRFNAGVVLERTDPDHVLAGVQSVVARYADLARGAARAGQALSTEHSPRRLFEALPR